MKYHINPETGKVSACRAKVKCRFGGSSGSENHFGSRASADSAAEAMLSSRYEATTTNSKSEFTTVRKNIQDGLVGAGIIQDASALPPVKNLEEIVEKWFSGDQKKFELVAHFSNPGSKLTANTRKSMGRLVATGADVRLSKSGSFDRAPSALVSEVELIDEPPADGPSQQAIAQGEARGF